MPNSFCPGLSAQGLKISQLCFSKKRSDSCCYPPDSNSRHLAHLPYLRCSNQLGCASNLGGRGTHHVLNHHPLDLGLGVKGVGLKVEGNETRVVHRVASGFESNQGSPNNLRASASQRCAAAPRRAFFKAHRLFVSLKFRLASNPEEEEEGVSQVDLPRSFPTVYLNENVARAGQLTCANCVY